jgi:amino acid transporter
VRSELDEQSSSAGTKLDNAQLQALGYDEKFDRTMTFWQNFSLGFTYLSPVCGVYSMFAFGLSTGGPPMVWSYAIACVGQLLVALVFGEIVSQFPISGGLYPWSRRLVGKRWSWMAGWIYGWALFTTIAAVAVGAGPFLTELLGIPSTPGATALLALGLVLISTVLNLAGTRLLARVALTGFVCEIIGAIVVGLHVIIFHRYHSIGVVFDRFGVGQGHSYLPAFFAAMLVGAYTCYGFEACGDVAEETADPGRAIPKAMRMTIYIGGGASVFIAVALVLGVADIPGAIAGRDANPIITVLRSAFGPVGAPFVVAVVLVSFISNVLSIQAAVSRLIFAYARDQMIIGSSILTRVSSLHIPVPALMVAGAIPAAIICLGYFTENALQVIVSFCTAGIYIAFQMVVAAALYARLRGWRPNGQFSLGALGYPVIVAGLSYGVFTIGNILWPRGDSTTWYTHYSLLLTVGAFIGTGLVYMIVGRPFDVGDAPAGDAWRTLPADDQRSSQRTVSLSAGREAGVSRG